MKIGKDVLIEFDKLWHSFWHNEQNALDWRTVAELFFIYGYKYAMTGKKSVTVECPFCKSPIGDIDTSASSLRIISVRAKSIGESVFQCHECRVKFTMTLMFEPVDNDKSSLPLV